MTISPSVASAIVAVLSSQGVATTNARVTDLLNPLFDSPITMGPELRFGESYLLMQNDEYGENAFTCNNLEELTAELKQIVTQLDSHQDLPGQVRVFITRRELELDVVQTVKVS